ncbi:L-serine ammonia-lyase [Gordonia sp. NPDC003424]
MTAPVLPFTTAGTSSRRWPAPTTSLFELFSIGLGPSSSHTVGPMRAAAMFVDEAQAVLAEPGPVELSVDLYGSLAATGRGHGTFDAVLLGLEGNDPATIDPDYARARSAEIAAGDPLRLRTGHEIYFRASDIALHPRVVLDRHTNGMRLMLTVGASTHEATYYSVGGGFVEREGAQTDSRPAAPVFADADDLLALCAREHVTIAEVVWGTECAMRPAAEVRSGLLMIWEAMESSIRNGLNADEDLLPGGLGVWRRAPGLYRQLLADHTPDAMDSLSVAAIAINEENAAGNRVVTAPTNGAAGIVPAVLYHLLHTMFGHDDPGRREQAIITYLCTAAAVAILVKQGASISGAEMGCQGEVGSACAMAAAGAAAIMGGTPAQVENAAEIGIEHNLGLTCDPIGGLVQIPCIERNAIASVKAVSAARMALRGNGVHRVSLDQAIATMRQTGLDMSSKYKETSLGGLAVNVPEC